MPNITSSDSSTPPSLETFNLQNVRVLSMGQLSLKINTISDAALNITGTTNPYSNLKAEFLLSSVENNVTGTSDSSGSFSLALSETLPIGTPVKLTANNNFKNKAETVTVVHAGALEFKTVQSELAFKSTVIPTAKTTIQRQEPDWSIIISDSRILSTDWNLYASIKKPFTSVNNHTIKEALVFIDEKDENFAINSDPTKIYSGNSVSSPTDTTIKWSENKGMLLVINPQNILADSYSTTVTWTLSDAP